MRVARWTLAFSLPVSRLLYWLKSSLEAIMSFYGIFFPRAAYYAGTKGEISLTGLVISTRRPASDFRSCFARIASLSPSAVRTKYSPVDLLTLRMISKRALCHFFHRYSCNFLIEITGEDHRESHNFLLLLDFLRFWKAYRRYSQYAIGLRDFCAVYRAEYCRRRLQEFGWRRMPRRSRSKPSNRRWSFERQSN